MQILTMQKIETKELKTKNTIDTRYILRNPFWMKTQLEGEVALLSFSEWKIDASTKK